MRRACNASTTNLTLKKSALNTFCASDGTSRSSFQFSCVLLLKDTKKECLSVFHTSDLPTSIFLLTLMKLNSSPVACLDPYGQPTLICMPVPSILHPVEVLASGPSLCRICRQAKAFPLSCPHSPEPNLPCASSTIQTPNR